MDCLCKIRTFARSALRLLLALMLPTLCAHGQTQFETQALSGGQNAQATTASKALRGGRGLAPTGQWPAHIQVDTFPQLPPDPDAPHQEPLPNLHDELWHHGGSYLYRPAGDQLNWPDKEHVHYDYLRLPADWVAPEPFTLFADFLGADAIKHYPNLRWPNGYSWEPRFVAAGAYEVFGTVFEQSNRDFNTIGHQLTLDLDLRLTGTEKFHVQFRPFGEDGTGGSYLKFDSPDEFVNNSTIEPQRYWFEGELHSIFSGFVDPFAPLDVGITVGRFPYALHNSQLINDELVGVVLNKNTLYLGDLSNLNLQLFYGFSEVDAFAEGGTQLFGSHASVDYKGVFYELTYALASHATDSGRNSHYAALSRTKMYGRNNVAMRALLKWGDDHGTGSGELLALESNRIYHLHHPVNGIEHFNLFCNAFVATEGWNGLGGENLNRLRTAFEVNPLARRVAQSVNRDTVGIAFGAQLFRKHDDESFIPEIAFETPGGEPVFGVGMRYLRKTSSQSYLDILGTANYSSDSAYDRKGVFLSHTIIF